MTTDSEEQALAHERVRRQHSAELAQDYVEAIYEISLAKEPVRVSSLVKIFGVSHVTVIRTLQRLKEQGLITDTRSKHIALTKEGQQMGKDSAARHELLRNFFISLGVSSEQANADAEGAEHHLSKETLKAIEKFLHERS